MWGQEMERSPALAATVEFMKDGEAGMAIVSKLDFVEIDIDEEGEPIKSCVLVEAETPAKEDRGIKLKPNEQTYLNILIGVSGTLSTEEWNERAKGAGLGLKRRADLHDYRESLRRNGLVYEGPNGWGIISK